MYCFKFLRGKLARGCQKMYPFAHARRLTAVLLTLLELDWCERFGDRRNNWKCVVKRSRRQHDCKTGHFTSWKEREQLRNVQKWKTHAQSVQCCCLVKLVLHFTSLIAREPLRNVQKWKKARAKCAQLLLFIAKYVNLWRSILSPLSSWLLKLPTDYTLIFWANAVTQPQYLLEGEL